MVSVCGPNVREGCISVFEFMCMILAIRRLLLWPERAQKHCILHYQIGRYVIETFRDHETKVGACDLVSNGLPLACRNDVIFSLPMHRYYVTLTVCYGA